MFFREKSGKSEKRKVHAASAFRCEKIFVFPIYDLFSAVYFMDIQLTSIMSLADKVSISMSVPKRMKNFYHYLKVNLFVMDFQEFSFIREFINIFQFNKILYFYQKKKPKTSVIRHKKRNSLSKRGNFYHHFSLPSSSLSFHSHQ